MEELKIAEREYKEAMAKEGQLKTDLNNIQGDLDEIDGKIRTIQGERKNAITLAAEMLLAGQYNNPNDVNPLFTARKDLATKQKVILEAIKMQEKIINEARTRYGILFGQSKRGEYAGIVREMVRAVVSLSCVIGKEAAFHNHFRTNGLSFTSCLGNPLNFPLVGSLEDKWGVTRQYLDDVVKRGYLTPGDILKLKQEVGKQGEVGRG